jgi:nitroimidazol reductase NimA-like FMN-containing flavoprotein (pyridoxamine 5'-phosphate oxidase superfamily)
MNKHHFTFSFIEKEIRSKTFGIINTVNFDGSPHTTGVLYGVSKPSNKFGIYIVTSKYYKKIKNIKKNPKVSFIIPFPHHNLRFVPSNTITITGIAEILSIDEDDTVSVFMEKRILRIITDYLSEEEKKELAVIKIKPDPIIQCYGVGISMWKLRKGHVDGGYSVVIPEERLQ